MTCILAGIYQQLQKTVWVFGWKKTQSEWCLVVSRQGQPYLDPLNLAHILLCKLVLIAGWLQSPVVNTFGIVLKEAFHPPGSFI